MDEQRDKLVMELRRGILVLATLSQLGEAQYGYSLKQQLAEQEMDIEEGTLYPLLRRMEKQGLIDSEWNTEGSRPRRYYVINDRGRSVLEALSVEWRRLAEIMENLLDVTIQGEM